MYKVVCTKFKNFPKPIFGFQNPLREVIGVVREYDVEKGTAKISLAARGFVIDWDEIFDTISDAGLVIHESPETAEELVPEDELLELRELLDTDDVVELTTSIEVRPDMIDRTSLIMELHEI